jgi:peroxiredoxin family protein
MIIKSLKRLVLLVALLIVGVVVELGVEAKIGFAGILVSNASAIGQEKLFFTIYGNECIDQDMGNSSGERMILSVVRQKSGLIIGVSEGNEAENIKAKCYKLVPHALFQKMLHIHEEVSCAEFNITA